MLGLAATRLVILLTSHVLRCTQVLTSAFIILTMQSGFGLLEMGSSSPGFEVNIMTKNVMDVVFGALTYWFVGYGLSYGEPSNPFMGMGGECDCYSYHVVCTFYRTQPAHAVH